MELLQKVADMAVPKTAHPNASTFNQRFDLDSFLSQHGIAIKREQPWSGGQRRIILERCPFNADHAGTSAAVLQFEEGAIAFKCQHNGCAQKSWADLRELFEPGYLERKQVAVEGERILQTIHHQLNAKRETLNQNEELPVSCLAEEDLSATSFPESAWTGRFADWRDVVSPSTEASLESLWSAFLL